jgi:Glycosyltransferase family 87
MAAPRREAIARALLWAAVALPGILQLALLAVTIAGRLRYPYDLEWMEGGLLHHALRLQEGAGIYVAPSIDFIPFLYTPLYPSLVALLGEPLGLSYTLGRAISVASVLGLAALAGAQFGRSSRARGPALAATALGLGMFAAAYPIVDGWYDLVRADALMLLMVTAALAGLPRWARPERDAGGGVAHARLGKLAAAGALLALAFFCKQTAIFYVAAGGAVVLALAPRRWRALAAFAAGAGVVGLGGCGLLQWQSDGWFWFYISELHRAHDFSGERFGASFGNVLWRVAVKGYVRYSALGAASSLAIATGLIAVGLCWWRRRVVPRAARPLLLWSAVYAVSVAAAAIGWGTEFAHFNAYMPAFLHGALAAGAAILAVHGCARAWLDASPRSGGTIADAAARRARWLAEAAALVPAGILALGCWNARWSPRLYAPTPRDAATAAQLVARIRALPGEVWIPSHPWYLHLAGKPLLAHRMGIKDVTHRSRREVRGLDEALLRQRFSALVLGQRDLDIELPLLAHRYRRATPLPSGQRPRMLSGARVLPDAIWLPAGGPATPGPRRVPESPATEPFPSIPGSAWPPRAAPR